MKIGMPILFEYKTIEENLILAKELGFDFIELNLNFPYVYQEIMNGNVKELLEKYNLEATLHYYDDADFGCHELLVDAHFKIIEQVVNHAKDYVKIFNFHNNAGPVVTISGKKNYIYEMEYEEYSMRLIHNLTKIKNLLDQNGIKMVIENVDTAKGATFLIENMRRLHEEGFSFNYDIGHDYLMGNQVYELYQNLPIHFDEFHFHDGTHTTCHLSLGTGEMDLKKYKDIVIKENSYCLLEVKSSEDLRESISYFKNL